MRLPIRTRLTVIFGTLMLVVIAATGTFTYAGLGSRLSSAIDDGLRSRAQVILGGIDASGINFGEESRLIESDKAFAQVLGRNGDLLEASEAVSQPLLTASEVRNLTSPRFIEMDLVVGGEGKPEGVRLLAVPSDEGPVVVVGTSLGERSEALGGLATLLWLGGPAAVVVLTGLAWFLAGAALRPVENMRIEASAISGGDLEKRLEVPETRDEVAHLASTLNEMLARLQQSFERERRFVDDASHELRTPLAILNTELDLALRRSRTTEELEAALKSAAEESQRLNRLAEDLLVLARSDRGRLPLQRSKVDAGALVQRVVGGLMGKASERRVHVETQVPDALVIEVDEVRMSQAIGNLMDNALNHTPPGGQIKVEVRVPSDAQNVVLSVTDSGVGFPEDFISRAFDPFARADAARSRRDGGAGLGLAIVKGVAEAHGGSASARNLEGGGAELRLEIPIPQQSELG